MALELWWTGGRWRQRSNMWKRLPVSSTSSTTSPSTCWERRLMWTGLTHKVFHWLCLFTWRGYLCLKLLLFFFFIKTIFQWSIILYLGVIRNVCIYFRRECGGFERAEGGDQDLWEDCWKVGNINMKSLCWKQVGWGAWIAKPKLLWKAALLGLLCQELVQCQKACFTQRPGVWFCLRGEHGQQINELNNISNQVLTDPHSPARFRINGPIANQPKFSEVEKRLSCENVHSIIWCR